MREGETIDLSKKRLHYIGSVSPEKTRGSPCDWLKAADANNKNLLEKVFILEKLEIHFHGNCAIPSSIFPLSDEGSFYHLSLHWTCLKPYFCKHLHRSYNFFHCHASFYLFSTYLREYTSLCNCEITQKYVFAKIHISMYLQKTETSTFLRWRILRHVAYWTRTPPALHQDVLLWLKNCRQGKRTKPKELASRKTS